MFRLKITAAALAAILFLTHACPLALAADRSSAETSSLVSQAEESFHKEEKKLKLAPPEKPEIAMEKETEIDPETKDMTVFVREIRIVGNTVFPEEVIQKYIAPFEYQEVSMGDLKSLAQTFTELYRISGYSNGRAYVPPQKIRDGVVTMKFEELVQAAEPPIFVREIHAEGNTLPPDDVLKKHFLPYEYVETTMTDLRLLAKQLTDVYRESGHPSGRAYLPTQEIVDGVAVMKFEEFAEREGPAFFVRKIALEGNTVIPEKALEKYLTPFEYNETTFEDLRALVQILTNLYRAAGYTTSRAYLPPQKIEDGLVKIKFLEGKIGEIYVEGNRYFAGWIYSDAITPSKGGIFRYQDLERSLYYLNQQPDRQAKAYLLPGIEPGTSDLILKAQEALPVHGGVEFNNRGTHLTHRSRYETYWADNNFLGRGDTLKMKANMAEEGAFQGSNFQYAYPLAKQGTTLRLDSNYVTSMLIGHLKSSEVKGRSFAVAPGITQSFVKTPGFALEGLLGFEVKDSKTLVDDLKLSYDRIRDIRLGPAITLQDEYSRTLISLDARWGIPDFLGGLHPTDIRSSQPNSGGSFTAYTAGIARIQKMPFSSLLLLRWAGQWTDNNLASAEQFHAGGVSSVRGYPESEVAGDYGHNFSAEINFPLYFIPNDWNVPNTKKKWNDTFRLAAFIDGAKTYLNNRLGDATVKSRFLLGTGVGVRFDLDPNLSVRLDVGIPIGDDSTDDRDRIQTHLSVRAGF